MTSGAAAATGTPSAVASTAPPLELEGVAHRFGRRWVLRGLDLTVGPGEVVAVLGDNGAGKSTLLRIAATLLRPLRGGGRVRGLDLNTEADGIRRLVGILGDSPSLYEDLTPEENLSFALAMRGMEKDPGIIAAILERVGLQEHARTRVRLFSQGMRRRVAIGRVLLGSPGLLLMDEPYASLDRGGVDLVNGLIGEVVAAGGGVLLATHDVHSGAEVTDRVLGLEAGRVQAAPVKDATSRPGGAGEGPTGILEPEGPGDRA